MDAIERSFYNAYLGALINEKSEGSLAVPLFYSYSPVYQNERWTLMGGGKNISRYARFGCCIAIGAAGLGLIPEVGVTEHADGVHIGLFMGGRYELNGTTIHIQTEYPYDGRVKITSSNKVALKLRIPDWCDLYAVDREYTVQNGYVCVELGAGESVNYTMQTPYKIISSKTVNPETEELFAVTCGPIVLCADSKDTDLYNAYALATNENGYAVGKKTENGYALKLKNGETLTLYEYKTTGRDYYAPREISVWLKKRKRWIV
jgi:DUF1680 family protein